MSAARPSPHWPTTALVDETQRVGEYLLAAVIVSELRRGALRDEALATPRRVFSSWN